MTKENGNAGQTYAISLARTVSRHPWVQLASLPIRLHGILPLQLVALLLLCSLSPTALAQAVPPTGAQELTFAGLRAATVQGLPQGQINAVRVDAQGNLYLLLDQKDGVRLLKTDSAAANVLAQAQIGAAGDFGLAMALDPGGNVYVTGTTTSGALAATPGVAFATPSGVSTNSFLAKFDANLNTRFVTFAGGSSMSATSIAATADAVFITGSIFGSTLPVTPTAIIQAPAYGSTQNGFVERFSTDGSTLVYATYLSGYSGSTTPAAIAADSADDAYIAGTTTSAGYPTIAAIVPESLGSTSGFLTKLTAAGDGITFSSYIPGAGITSLALDPSAGNLLLAGSVSLGQFPVSTVAAPLTPTTYQTLLRMSLDGSTVLQSTLLAPAAQSYVAAGTSGTAWVAGSLSLPLLPVAPLSTVGNSFALRVNAAGAVDQAARFGGLAASNPGNASAPVALTSIAVDSGGNPIVAGNFAPTASQALLATQTFDLPLASAPTAAFPSSVRAAVLPPSACAGSLCAGSAAYLARLSLPASASPASASLTLSVDDSPNLTLRNLGSAQATGLQIAVTGFTSTTNCGTTLAAGGECGIALAGSGPGSIAVSAANATAQTAALPVLASGVTALPIAFSPKELDFGVVSSASGNVTGTLTVTNLTTQSQTFASALDSSAKSSLPYTFTQTGTDCTLAGAATMLLAPGASCHITIGLAASSNSANDGAVHANWLVGARDVQMTAYTQAAALSLSASEIDFGTQYSGGPRLPRYLYLSNNSTVAYQHAAVTLPASSPFSVTDGCPDLLEPFTVCQLELAYQSARVPSTDAVTLSLDEGLTALVTGTSLPQPATNGAAANPNLSVSSTSLSFAGAVVVTGVSAATQTLTIQNTGASSFALTLALTGDFTDTTNCGATLAGGATCRVVLSFAPSEPGPRQGLLAVTAGAGTKPVYVTLTGTGTGILSPANNGTLSFGGTIAGQPVIQWFKVTQPFTSFSASVAGSSFGALLVEDVGYGHGQPSVTTFTASASGTCYNCWLGVAFTPAAAGLTTGTLSLASATGGDPYVLTLTGNGLPLTGLLLTPVAQDFGPVSIHSISGAQLFTLTNLVPAGNAITVTAPTLTGDFAVSGATNGRAFCGGTLAYTASCYVPVVFTPTAEGTRTGALTLQAGSTVATATLTGYGSPDPGLALSPTALTFNEVPGIAATQQTITLTNTSAASEQIGEPIASAGFTASGNCANLAPASTCSTVVTFIPSTAPVTGTLQIPVTASVGGAPVTTTYAVPLTGAYTTQDSGLEILPADAEYGPQSTGAPGTTRQFTLNNLTAKTLALSLALPRQFILSGSPCTSLAPNASCNFAVSFLPLTNGDATGTLFAQATPTDGSAILSGLGYVEGYGLGSAQLAVTGNFAEGGVLNFGQVPSGQSAQQTLTLANASTDAPLNIRRITSGWPFPSTTTCGATLAPAASCTVTLAYTPLNQVAAGSSPPPSTAASGTLVIESDAITSPNLIDLAGASTPVTVASPSNIAAAAILTPSTSSLTFPYTTTGSSSAPQSVTLSNSGTAALNLLGIHTTPNFSATGNCTTLVPGATCTFTITFTPQSPAPAGTFAGAVEIASNAGTSLEYISLAGDTTPATVSAALTLAPTSLNFGSVSLGANSSLSAQLSNTGASPVTLTAFTTTGDYSVANGTCPAAGGTLAAGASCALQITFAPTQSGTRTGTLSVSNSATSSPLTASLTGVGLAAPSFTVTVNGSASASSSVAPGSSASYNLLATPLNGFISSVSLSCTTVVAAQYASCSILPSSLNLSASAQTAVATITTVTTLADARQPPAGRSFASTALALLFPWIVFTWKARTSRHHAWHVVGPIAWAVVSSIALLTSSGCGGSQMAPAGVGYTPAGTYQYQVTATSGSITQTVTLNLTVQ